MRFLNTWKVPFACALSLTSLPLALIIIARTTAAPPGRIAPPPLGAAVVAPAAGAVEVSLNDALGRHWLDAQYVGNGHSEIKATVANRYNKPLRLTFGSGLIFETADLRQQMVVARAQTLDLPVASTRAAWLPCAATRSANTLSQQPYGLCPDTLPDLDAPVCVGGPEPGDFAGGDPDRRAPADRERAAGIVRQVQPALRRCARLHRPDRFPGQHG